MADLVKKLSILAFSLLMASCLTIEAGIELRDDFSGVFRYSASISTLAADLEKTDARGSAIPFPLLSNAVDNAASASGVRIARFDQSDDGTRYFVDCELIFDNLESLSTFTGIQFLSESSGNNTVLSVTVYPVDEGEAVSPDVLNIVRNSFSDDFIEIQTVIPGDIIRVEGAVFTGSTVTFRTGLAELLESSETVQFTVEYR